jgi:hypothetical protein
MNQKMKDSAMKHIAIAASTLLIPLLLVGCFVTPQVITFPDGTAYQGQAVNGVPEGRGVITFANGNVYDGQIHNGQPHGKGKLAYADGASFYEGYFKDGLRHGKGVLTRPFSHMETKTVVIYTGTFVNDKGEGPAVQEVKGMFTIVASCHDCQAYGPGKRTYVNGDTYVGEFRDNHHYNGIYTWANGDTYEGTFDGFNPHGKNVKKTFADGSVYRGDISRRLMHGNGDLTFADGTRYKGTFVKDKMHGTGSITYPNGSHYEGEFKDDQIGGKGIFTAADGTETATTL